MKMKDFYFNSARSTSKAHLLGGNYHLPPLPQFHTSWSSFDALFHLLNYFPLTNLRHSGLWAFECDRSYSYSTIVIHDPRVNNYDCRVFL